MYQREKTQAEEFEEQVQGDNYFPSWEDQQEFCQQEGDQLDRDLGRTNDNPFDGCDPRDGRVLDSERDARLRHKDYDEIVERFVVPAIHRNPDLFVVLRDSADAGEASYALGQLLRDPALANHPKYRDFESYLRGVASRRTGRFDNLSVKDFEKVLQHYKENGGDETIDEFFDK